MATLALWLLTLVALSLSTYAAIVSFRTSDRSLLRQLSELSTQLEEARLLHAQLAERVVRLNARLSMRNYRERERQDGDAQPISAASSALNSSDEEKARVRRELSRKLALNQVKPGG